MKTLDTEPRIELAHGAGGGATGRLVRELFLRHFDDPRLGLLNDGACLGFHGPIAFSTDAFVVDPIFFPGGDIGTLAICGTVNDVAMCGAIPRALSAAFILEEGLPIADLERLVRSMADQSRSACVAVVTGDTKVVPRGHADSVYITTAGVGEKIDGIRVGGEMARTGDHVLISGPVGDHGTTIMAVRAALDIGESLRSDCTPVNKVVQTLLEEVPTVHCLRDPTRGGLAAALNEIAIASDVGIEVREKDVPVSEPTRSACEILGLDPLSMACEGRFVALLPENDVGSALEVLARFPQSANAKDIGNTSPENPGKVVLQTSIGGRRLLDVAEGEPLPRIC